MGICDCVGVSCLSSSVDAGTDWKGNRIRTREIRAPKNSLTSNVELLDFPPSSGLSEKSFAIELHPRLSPLSVDLPETEPELLLLGGKIRVDTRFFPLFSTKASKPAEPIVALLSLFGFHVLDSVGVGSGLSGIVSWTTSRSSELRPTSDTLPNRGVRDFPLLDRVIIASILSTLSSSLGVGREEKLDAVIVGDRAGRLDLVISDCSLCLFIDLPRLTSSAFCLTSLGEKLVAIGGGRLLSRRDGVEGNSSKSTDEDKGESGRGIARGSTGFTEGIEGSACAIYRSTGGSG